VVRSISAWWRGQSHWLQHQQTGYSLVWVQHTTALAKWLAGLSGAALVLIYALYMRSYLSILSIRGDCVSREFVANVHKAAAYFLVLAVASGVRALAAISWPALVAFAATGAMLLVRGGQKRHYSPDTNSTDSPKTKSLYTHFHRRFCFHLRGSCTRGGRSFDRLRDCHW
jgi:hypothetical protein